MFFPVAGALRIYLCGGKQSLWNVANAGQIERTRFDVELFENNPGNKVKITDLFAGKKGILLGVPGAFTPTCSRVSAIISYICVFTSNDLSCLIIVLIMV